MISFKEILTNIRTLELWLIGNLTKDRRIFPTTLIETGGGPITFTLPWLLLWVPHVNVQIFCSGPKGSVQHLPKGSNVHIHLQEDPHTAVFELDYRHVPRQLRLLESPSPLQPELFTTQNPVPPPDVIIFCPVFNEISEALVILLKQRYPAALTVLDGQGFTRRVAANNSIALNTWIPSSTFLASLDILTLSNDEITSNKIWKVLTTSQHTNIILTAGERGSLLYSSAEIKDVYGICPPSPIMEKPVDPTGAGDVFLAFVGVGYFSTKNIVISMAFSTILTKFHLAGIKLDKLFLSDDKTFQELIDAAQNDFDQILHWKWMPKTYLDKNPWEDVK